MAVPAASGSIDFLLRVQNPDGGWGYLPHKQSWLEPTALAMLALHELPGSAKALEKAWAAVRSWRRPDGGWRPCPSVDQSTWATSLAVTLHCVRGIYDSPFRQGIEWLARTRGQEGSWWKRVVNRLQPNLVEHDARLQGWPWLPANSSWVEPTAHALVALKKSLPDLKRSRAPLLPAVEARIEMAEKMMLDRRCADGGWNYGNKRVQDVTLPSYPETTALALLGLQGRPLPEVRTSLDWARGLYGRTNSRLARAWLAICLRNHGAVVDPPEPGAPTDDVLVAALEALGSPHGNFALLRTEWPAGRPHSASGGSAARRSAEETVTASSPQERP